MEKTLVLKAEVRKNSGTKFAKTVRESGRIPAIVYGHKMKAVAVSVDAHDFVEGMLHGHRLFDVQIDKKIQKIIVKEIQYDHLGKMIIHADFMRVDVTENISIEVPIEIKGTAVGTHEGGIVEVHVDRLEIECKVTKIPESIVVSVKEIGLGDAIYAADIELPEGVKLISPPQMLIVTCHQVAAAKTTEELEQEVPIAPEVIGEVKEEEPSEQQKEG